VFGARRKKTQLSWSPFKRRKKTCLEKEQGGREVETKTCSGGVVKGGRKGWRDESFGGIKKKTPLNAGGKGYETWGERVSIGVQDFSVGRKIRRRLFRTKKRSPSWKPGWGGGGAAIRGGTTQISGRGLC